MVIINLFKSPQTAVAMFTTLVGVGISCLAWKTIWRPSRRSLSWSSVPGVVLSNEIRARRDSENEAFRAIVTYRYAVAGREYRGNTVFFGDWVYAKRRAAETIVVRYEGGATVAVFFDPGDPERSVLEPGMHWQGWIVVAAGCVITLVGVALFLTL